MEAKTASEVGHRWLKHVGAIEPRRDRVADALELVVPDPDAWGCTPKGDGARLAVVAGKGLWVATATLDGEGDLESLSIERFDLKRERVRASFRETYSPDSATPVSEWRFTLVDGTELTPRRPATGVDRAEGRSVLSGALQGGVRVLGFHRPCYAIGAEPGCPLVVVAGHSVAALRPCSALASIARRSLTSRRSLSSSVRCFRSESSSSTRHQVVGVLDRLLHRHLARLRYVWSRILPGARPSPASTANLSRYQMPSFRDFPNRWSKPRSRSPRALRRGA
jgi:hypothetical protein